MGSTSYSVNDRSVRTMAFCSTTNADQVFEQNVKRRIHDLMDPKGIKIREARDSSVHPLTVPIVLGLDVTGSMGHIPYDLVKTGLPTMMGNMIQNGVKDAALLFLAIGDTECDRAPLQVGQFESGDAELDGWLTKTWLEKGGGSNAGESYHLAWYFAAYHTITDAWEKRKQKGFLFTVGDEPCLNRLHKGSIEGLMGNTVQDGFDTKDLLKAAQEKYNVYHLHIMEGSAGQRSLGYWQRLLGQNCLVIDDFRDVPKVIAETVVTHTPESVKSSPDVTSAPPAATPGSSTEILL